MLLKAGKPPTAASVPGRRRRLRRLPSGTCGNSGGSRQVSTAQAAEEVKTGSSSGSIDSRNIS